MAGAFTCERTLKSKVNPVSVMGDSNSTRFMVAAAKQVFVSSAMLIVQILVFAISAGGIADIRPWLFFGTAFVHYVVSIAVQYKVNPQLLVRWLKR